MIFLTVLAWIAREAVGHLAGHLRAEPAPQINPSEMLHRLAELRDERAALETLAASEEARADRAEVDTLRANDEAARLRLDLRAAEVDLCRERERAGNAERALYELERKIERLKIEWECKR